MPEAFTSTQVLLEYLQKNLEAARRNYEIAATATAAARATEQKLKKEVALTMKAIESLTHWLNPDDVPEDCIPF